MKRRILRTLVGVLVTAGLVVNCTLFAADGDLSPWSAAAHAVAPLSSLGGSTGSIDPAVRASLRL